MLVGTPTKGGDGMSTTIQPETWAHVDEHRDQGTTFDHMRADHAQSFDLLAVLAREGEPELTSYHTGVHAIAELAEPRKEVPPCIVCGAYGEHAPGCWSLVR